MQFVDFFARKIIEQCQTVRIFHLGNKQGEIPPYRAGNFFLLRLPDENGKLIFRPYSAASSPWECDLVFTIRLKGAFTRQIWKLKEGDLIGVSGPYGLFTLDENDEERVFAGGGVGIAPLRSMILHTLAKEAKPAALFHSARKRGGLAFYDELKGLAAKNEDFSYFPSITGDEKPDGWGGMSGRITASTIKQKLVSLSGKTFYLCGPKGMASSLFEELQAEGVPKERIKKEEWG